MTEKETTRISEAPRELRESIKVSKMSKGNQWEIRVFIEDWEGKDNDKTTVDRIDKIYDRLRETYGDGD